METIVEFPSSVLGFINPGLVIVHLVGFVLWSSVPRSEVPLTSSGRALALSEFILILVWISGQLQGLQAVLLAYVWVRIFEHWTGRRATLKTQATFSAGKFNIFVLPRICGES